MNHRQFEAYLRHAVACGFVETGKPTPPEQSPTNAQLHRIAELRAKVIELRLHKCALADRENQRKVESRYVDGVVAKATRGRHESWWTRHEAWQVIEALTDMVRRLS